MSRLPPQLDELYDKLHHALEHGNIHEAIEVRTAANALVPRGLTRYGEAIELLRRAERAVALLVRRGQQGPDKYIHARGDGFADPVHLPSLMFFSSGAERRDSYIMVDGVTTEEFEKALQQCKEMNNLSRANLVSVITGRKPPGYSDRPDILKKHRRSDPVRVIEETVSTLEGVVLGLRSLEPMDLLLLTHDDAERWSKSLSRSVSELNRLRKGLNNVRFQ